MLIRRPIHSVVRWNIWPLRWSTGEDTHRVQTGGLWEYSWYTHSTPRRSSNAYIVRKHVILRFAFSVGSLRC